MRVILVLALAALATRAELDARLAWAPPPDPLAGQVSDAGAVAGLPGIVVEGDRVRATSRDALEHARHEARIAGARFDDPVEDAERATARFAKKMAAGEAVLLAGAAILGGSGAAVGAAVTGIAGLGGLGALRYALDPMGAAVLVLAQVLAARAGARAGACAWGRRLGLAGVVFLALDALLAVWGRVSPPAIEGFRRYALDARAPDDRRYGPNRLARSHGLWVAHVEGTAYEIGRALSELAGPLALRNEDALVREFYAHVPTWPVRWALVRGVPFLAGPMVGALPAAYPEEVRGIADVGADPWGWVAPAYTRKLCYHAIHDVGQAMVDGPLLACTGFAAGGPRTVDGRWLLARNFDFDGGRFFDEDKAVVVVARDGAIPFVHVAILGLSGVVSGLNAEGLAVALLAGASDAPVRAGAPMIFVVREILEEARSIDDARVILARRKGFVSEGLLVVDGKRGEAAVLEVTPDDVDVLPAEGGAIALTNHFRGRHAGDAETKHRIAEGTTAARLARVEELLAAAPPLDDAGAAAILRDRKGVGGAPLPDGHEATLDADIASHGAVLDATSRTILVSTWPNLAGGWVRFSLDDLLAGRLDGTVAVPARDPERTLAVHEARRLVRLARDEPPSDALVTLDRALALVPGDVHALVARAKAKRALGRDGDPDLRAALATPPARAAEVREIEALLGDR